MSCRRICRELLWQARFGELGPGSAPHLDHLSECRSCREELGFDRALVRQLRTALADRVAGASPGPRVWEGIRARMAAPEPQPSRIRAWSTVLVARLRVASAMAGASLAILLALNVEVVAIRSYDAAPPTNGPSAFAPPRPPELADGFALAAADALRARGGELELEPAFVLEPVPIVGSHEPEQLPILGARQATPSSDEEEASGHEDAASQPAPAERQTLTIRLVPGDAAVVGGSSRPTTAPEQRDDSAVESLPLPSGTPS